MVGIKRWVSAFENNHKKRKHEPTKYTFTSPYRQQFLFPKTIIYYLVKNKSNPNAQEKLIKTCKYFFQSNPLILVKNIICGDWGFWLSYIDEFYKGCFPLVNEISRKLWIIGEFKAKLFCQNSLLKLSKNIYICDIAELDLYDQNINYEVYKKLISSKKLKKVSLIKVKLKKVNGEEIPLESMIKECHNIEEFYLYQSDHFTNQTTQKLLDSIKFNKLKKFTLIKIPMIFDYKTFSKFIKKHNEANFLLAFPISISDEIKKNIRVFFENIREELKDCCLTIRFGWILNDAIYFGRNENEDS